MFGCLSSGLVLGPCSGARDPRHGSGSQALFLCSDMLQTHGLIQGCQQHIPLLWRRAGESVAEGQVPAPLAHTERPRERNGQRQEERKRQIEGEKRDRERERERTKKREEPRGYEDVWAGKWRA